MSSAASIALSIPELLQNIFQHLPQTDLLVSAPLVSRTWHTTIISSPLLQRQLFFAPCPTSPLTVNPLLASKFPALFDKPHFAQPFDMPTTRQDSYAAFWFALSRAIRRYVIQAEDLWGMECFATDRVMAAYLYPEASWKRMLVVQPPATMGKGLRDEETGRQQCREVTGESAEKYLTMGLWFDGMVQAMQASLKGESESKELQNNLWKEGREMVIEWGESREMFRSSFRELFQTEWFRDQKPNNTPRIEQVSA